MPVCKCPRAAYIHIPFCVSKCSYCDFNSYPGMESIYEQYVQSLIAEINKTPPCDEQMRSIYIGGGTPTVLSAVHLSDILAAVENIQPLSKDLEVTLEANPGTVDEHKLAQLYESKFNRLSIGVQSLDDDFLALLGRAHTSEQAIDVYNAARSAGFSNISIDLIFALPGQMTDHWSHTLDSAIALNPEHISLYELTIEEGTKFSQLCAAGRLSLPSEDSQIDMYELAIGKMKATGYEHYEVSNFAKPGFRCSHNQVYWQNEPYYGFGAGATSYIAGDRSLRIGNPKNYISAIDSGGDAIESTEHLTGRKYLAETLIQSLRMLDGVNMKKLSERTDADVSVEFAPQIDSLISRGLLEWSDSILKVTHQGLLLLNDVSQEFLE